MTALGLVALAGCGDGTARTTSTDGPYALLRDAEWTLQEAVDPARGDPVASIERPPLDWWAEYVQTAPSESRMVRLSGHPGGFAETRAELVDLGFVLDDVTVDGRSAARGTSADDPLGPQLVLLDAEGQALLMLSYELDVGPLTDLAAGVEVVDEATWVNAGGVIR